MQNSFYTKISSERPIVHVNLTWYAQHQIEIYNFERNELNGKHIQTHMYQISLNK